MALAPDNLKKGTAMPWFADVARKKIDWGPMIARRTARV
jgi:hypothetical protein